MSKKTTCIIMLALLLMFSREVKAQGLSLCVKLLDTSQNYKVQDKSRDLAAELTFPSQALVGQIEYTYKTSNTKLSGSLEYSLSSSQQRGTDTDWYQGDVSVFSESKTNLDKYYALALNYEHILGQGLSVQTTLFHKYWKLYWSDTKQYDYIDDVYSEFSEKSVQFTQRLNGIAFNLAYHDEIFSVPVSISVGAQAANHYSKDEHLLRNFYTLTQDWLYGYLGNFSAELTKSEAGTLSLMAGYEVLSGDGDMKFYSSSDFNYMTLPASFETEQRFAQLKYSVIF